MLKNLTRKLCPFVTLALAFGCGKKIGETEGRTSQSIQTQDLSSVLTLRLDSFEGSRSSYKLIRDGRFKLPEKLIVKQGDSRGKKVTITYNLSPDDDYYPIKCTYASIELPEEMPLEKCVNYNDSDLEDVIPHEFLFDEDHYIQMDLSDTNASGLVIDAVYSVFWI